MFAKKRPQTKKRRAGPQNPRENPEKTQPCPEGIQKCKPAPPARDIFAPSPHQCVSRSISLKINCNSLTMLSLMSTQDYYWSFHQYQTCITFWFHLSKNLTNYPPILNYNIIRLWHVSCWKFNLAQFWISIDHLTVEIL